MSIGPRLVALFIASACLLGAGSAKAFFDPPWITPANPMAGESISVHIHGGNCDHIVTTPGYPQITRAGQAIRLVERGHHYPEGSELCVITSGTVVRNIGTLPTGSYALSVDMIYDDPVGDMTLHIGDVAFAAVSAPAPEAIPATGFAGGVLLLCLLLCAGYSAIRDWRAGLFAIFLLSFARVSAGQTTGTIEFSLTSAAGARTPAQVVSWLHGARTSAPPLGAFAAVAPLGGDFLIPDRATGDFLAWLTANPLSARRKLEDQLLGEYLIGDIPAALSALQSDPNVAWADASPRASSARWACKTLA